LLWRDLRSSDAGGDAGATTEKAGAISTPALFFCSVDLKFQISDLNQKLRSLVRF
jgi:hypothetical protein